MDDLERKILEAKENELEPKSSSQAIYSKAGNLKPVKPKTSLNLKLVFVNAFILLLAIGFFTFGIIKISNNGPIAKQPKFNRSEASKIKLNENKNIDNNLKAFESEEELINYINQNKKYASRETNKSDELAEEEVAPGDAAPNGYSSTGNPSSYQTNTRTEGVDETDIVKVNNDYIYYLTHNYTHNYENDYSSYEYFTLTIYKHIEDDIELIKVHKFNQSEEIITESEKYVVKKITSLSANSGMYVTDKYIIVPVNTYEREVVFDKETNKILSIYSYHYYSEINIYDINSCELVQTIRTTGFNNQTRLVGNELFIINSYYDFLLNNNNKFAYPCFWINDEEYSIDYRSLYYYPNDDEVKVITSVYRVTLDDEMTIDTFNMFTGYSNLVYMSTNNLYIISNTNHIKREENYQKSFSQSRVISLNIKGEIFVNGEMTVDGIINDHYWIDEKDNYVRFVSIVNEYETWYFEDKYVIGNKHKSNHFVTIFEKTENGFKEISKITEGIGKPGESIRSVRFNGDILTVVTYKTIDPIYYIDLSDPNNIKITSEYEITGYSTYQIPYKDNYVLGFGYETNESRNTGIKITLFDVSDKTDIKAVGKSYVIPYEKITINGYVRYISLNVEALNNPKAMLIDRQNDLFGFGAYAYYSRDTYSTYNFYGAYFLFKVDLEKTCPIVLVNKTENKGSGSWSDVYYHDRFDRMVYVGNNYYLLSPSSIYVYRYDNGEFDEIKVVK